MKSRGDLGNILITPVSYLLETYPQLSPEFFYLLSPLALDVGDIFLSYGIQGSRLVSASRAWVSLGVRMFFLLLHGLGALRA